MSSLTYRDLSRRDTSIALLVLLLARLVLGLAYSALIPLGETPDEADHYAYAAYIGNESRLPDAPPMAVRGGEGPAMTQSKHPPLYHVLAALMARFFGAEMDSGFLRSNPDVGVGPGAAAPNFFVHTTLEEWPWRDGPLAMHLGRLVSVVAALILTAATYALGRAIWPAWRSGALAAAAFVAFLPEALFVGGAMSNDLLAAMWCTLALWAGLRASRLRYAILAGVSMGLAFLTKANTAGLWPVVSLAMLLQGLQGKAPDDAASPGAGHSPGGGRGQLWRTLGGVGLADIIALLIAAPWLWRNWRLYGDLLGWPVVLATIDRRQGPLGTTDLLLLARGWFVSFWGKFGGAGHLSLPIPFYVVWIGLVVVAIAGWCRLWRRRHSDPIGAPTRAGWVVLLGALLMTILSILLYSQVALGTDQGRLLFPALAPVALLLVRGVAAWLPDDKPAWLPAGMAGGMALTAVLALELGIVRPFGPPPAPAQAEIAETTSLGEVFGDELELVAFHWAELPPSYGQARGANASLTLYWRALRPVTDDLRTTVRLTDSAGHLAWEWKRSPGAGRFSTDRWSVSRLIGDVYRIPAEVLARAARVEVGVRPFPEGDWLSLANHSGERLLPIPKEGNLPLPLEHVHQDGQPMAVRGGVEAAP